MPESVVRDCPFKIGATPLTRYKIEIDGVEHELCLKEERYSEFGSIKDRVAWYVLSRSLPSPDWKGAVVDASSGNYGYALARIGQRLGLKVTIVSSPSISEFNAAGIKDAGAELVIAHPEPGESSNGARMRMAGDIAEQTGALFLDQYRNDLNPESHELWTAPEVFSEGEFDACFMAASSGGTTRGFYNFLQKSDLHTQMNLVEPTSSKAFQDVPDGLPKGLFIPGYGSGRRSSFADESLAFDVIRVEEAKVMAANHFLKAHGLSDIGLSSVGVVTGAIKWLTQQDSPKRVVCICADGGERYNNEIDSRYIPAAGGDVVKNAEQKLSARISSFGPVSDLVST